MRRGGITNSDRMRNDGIKLGDETLYPPCQFCGSSERKPGGEPIKFTLWKQAEDDRQACWLAAKEFVLHRECIWSYLDTHPIYAISRF